MNHIVSIVVPAYNRAARVEATLLSLAAQDYENIEIIVVDDGSSDGTYEAAENVLKSSGRRFKMIRHDTNMGVSVARNNGFSAASGDYVIFFDSDDLADTNFVSVLLKTITENDGSSAFCGHRIEHKLYWGSDSLPKYSAEELTIMHLEGKLMTGIGAVILKTSFLKTEGLEFIPGCTNGEDLEFVRKAFSRCYAINFSTECPVAYVQHEGQATKIKTPEVKIRNMIHNTEAYCRSTLYLAERAISPKVRGKAKKMLPSCGRALVKALSNAASRLNDKETFDRLLNAPSARQWLKAGLKNFIRDPKAVLKAIILLTAPDLYFWARSKVFR